MMLHCYDGAPGKPRAGRVRLPVQANSSPGLSRCASLRQLLAQPANARNLDLLLGYARLLYENEKYDAAMQMANRAVEADANNASAHFWRARILQQQNLLPEAVAEAEKARDLAPASPAPRNLLVRIYLKLGRAGDAARETAWLRTQEVPTRQ
jgi:tetratricopeptide (TPR) repeat protein